MASPIIQSVLNAGEISPALYGRTDLKKYREGCTTLRNMFASYKGGATSRAGTKFVGQARQSASDLTPQLIPFQFNIDQGYALAFSDQEMSVIANGAYVTDAVYDLTSVTNANPGVFTSAPDGPDYAVGNWIYLRGMLGMTELNGGTYAINSILGTDVYTLKSTLTGDVIDTSGFGVYTGGGQSERIFTLATPYVSADLQKLKWAQSADVMTITHPNYPPMDLTRLTLNAWTLTTTTFTASISPPTSTSARASSTTTTSSMVTQYQYVVTSVDKLTGEESVASPIATVTNSVNIAQTLGSEFVSWSAVSGAAYYNVYKATPAVGGPVPVGALFGFAGSSYGLSFVDTNITQDMTTTPPQHLNPFAPGAIDYFTITNGGTGYTTAILPTVVITDATGGGATAEAVVVGTAVAAVVVTDGGSNYTNPSVQIISGTGGSGANITPNAASFFRWDGHVTINSGGSGYVNPVVTAQYFVSGVGNVVQPAITVGVSGGVINNTPFDPPAYTVLYTQVTIVVQDSAGSGATATAHVGPADGTYPSCVAYFQQRRFYANTDNNPDTYFASQPGAFTNMDRSIPVVASDAIVGTPWAQQVNGIQAMVPMPGGLVVLTGLGAWQLNGGSAGAAVTPIDQVATPQSYNGCHDHIHPIPINFDILYVQEKGSIVRDINYNFFANIYTGQDLTELSSHLFTNFQIERWDWAEEPYKLLWAVRDDGKLLSMTYRKTPSVGGGTGDGDVYSWARHDTNGEFTSVCCVTELPVDAPYFVTRRFIPGAGSDGVYYIERMDNRTWTTIYEAWCLDCALDYPQVFPNATLNASSPTGTQNITSYSLVTGGSGYTAPIGQIIDLAGTGSGASVSLTVSGGVIVSATAVTTGSFYKNPQLTILDATGSGAAIQPIVTNYVTFTASSGVFSSGDVGKVIRMGWGRADVVTYSNSTTLIANIVSPITQTIPNDPNNRPLPRPSGEWTLTEPTTIVHGLDHLEGMAVTALADGGVVNDLTVTDGTVTLPQAASQIVVGLPFTAQLQTMYLENQGGPTVQTRRKDVTQVVLRVESSRAPEIGVNQPDAAAQPAQAEVPWTQMTQIEDRLPAVYAGTPVPLFSGDYSITNVFGSWDAKGQIAIQQTDPLPLSVTALVPWVTLGDTPGQ